MINPNLVINQRFEESRDSARVDAAIAQKSIFREKLKRVANCLIPSRHVAEFSIPVIFPEVFYLIASYIRTGSLVKLDQE